jgi:hypothetical protein
MRPAVSAVLFLGLMASPALLTTASADTMKNCAANWKAMAAADKAKTTYKGYSSTCLKGGAAPAAMAAPAPAPMAMAPVKPARAMKSTSAMAMPASGAAPAGATGMCNDGTYTMSKTHSGACSHHKGVARWL